MIKQRNTSSGDLHATTVLLLTWNAGVLDALSYIRGHVFTANMTGNTVLLGIHLVQGDFPDAIRSGVAFAAFAISCLIAALILLAREDLGRDVRALGFFGEWILLIIFAALFQLRAGPREYLVDGALIVTAAMALAVQSVIVRDLRVSGVATTFITGTITTAAVGAVRLLRRQTPPQKKHEEEHAGLLLALLTCYLIAVVYGTFFNRHAPLLVALTPAAILGVVFLRSKQS